MSARGLQNKVAVVTGAAGGVGREVVRMLREQGAKVVGVDVQESVRMLRENDESYVGYVGDVRDASTAKDAIEICRSRWKVIDILITLAGCIVPKPIAETTEDEWDLMMETNVKGVYFFCREAIPEMVKRGSGAVVLMSSISGVVGLASQSGYCASKGALSLLTKQMAIDYARHGIRVNAVAPGAIDTPFLDFYIQSQPDTEKFTEAVRAAHPLRRWAQPDEVAAAILFLASDAASFITGDVLSVDGGYTAQ